MARSPSRKRETFHHGNVLEELIDAALQRIRIQGVDSITLRDLASDVGINHRAIYRHCLDKETLLAEVAERCWRDFLRHLINATAGMVPGRAMLVAAGVAMFQWGRENPQDFHFATGAYPSLARRFPKLGRRSRTSWNFLHSVLPAPAWLLISSCGVPVCTFRRCMA
jgi:AcrR family transcriptional regulator